MAEEQTQWIKIGGVPEIGHLECGYKAIPNVTQRDAGDSRGWFISGARWVADNILQMINDYVDEQRRYQRKGEFEHGFLHGVEKFAEHLTEKLKNGTD